MRRGEGATSQYNYESAGADEVGKYVEVGRAKLDCTHPKVTTRASKFPYKFRQPNFVLQVWEDETSTSCYRKK